MTREPRHDLVRRPPGSKCTRCVASGCPRPRWVTAGSSARQTGAVGVDTSHEARQVLYDGDGAVTLAVARSLGLDGPLQMVGELALLALAHGSSEAADFAAQCTGALRVRACDGDQELADAIDAARGIAVSDADPLKDLAVDLEQLADLIDGGPESAGGRLDLTTGEVWPEFAFEDTFEEEEEDALDRWLHVCRKGRGGPTTTWSTSPPRARTSGYANNSITRWTAVGRSAGSRTSCSTGQMTARTGSCSPKTVAAAEPENGSPMRGIAPRYETGR